MKSYVAEVLFEGHWHQDDARFATWLEAYEYGLDPGNRRTVTGMRVAESDDEPNCVWKNGKLEAVDPPADTGGMDWSLVDFITCQQADRPWLRMIRGGRCRDRLQATSAEVGGIRYFFCRSLNVLPSSPSPTAPRPASHNSNSVSIPARSSGFNSLVALMMAVVCGSVRVSIGGSGTSGCRKSIGF